jgi:hypothetical protein
MKASLHAPHWLRPYLAAIMTYAVGSGKARSTHANADFSAKRNDRCALNLSSDLTLEDYVPIAVNAAGIFAENLRPQYLATTGPPQPK